MTPRNLIEPARLAGGAVLRSQSDDRLIDLVRAGNDRAFEAIVHRYRRPLLRYCGRFLTGPRAEDAVQQTFMNAYRAMKADERDIDLRPWLYRIAHNASLNTLRAGPAATEEPISEEIDGVERPDQALERRQSLLEVVAAVQALPPRQRDAIVLHELEGRSYEQIATELKVSGGAVRQLLSRARTTLRAGATALVPEAAFARLASAGSDPVAARVAEIVAAGGGVAVVAKVGTAVVVAGAVAVGAAEGPLHTDGDGGSGRPAQRQAAVFTPGGSDDSAVTADSSDPVTTVAAVAHRRADSDRGHKGEPASKSRRHRRGRGRGRGRGDDDDRGEHTSFGSGSGGHGSDDRSGGGEHSGPGGGSGDGERSGSGSGSGSGSTQDDHSGSGSSGPGSGSDDGTVITEEPDHSGSGSSGPDGGGSGSHSGSGSDDPVASMPTPASDSSGPGSGRYP